MNKFTRLFVVVLTLALLVGAVVGITASANDGDVAYEEKDLILSHNVSYADYMHLYVAIDSTLAVDAEGITAKIEMNGVTYDGVAADASEYENAPGHVIRTPGVAAKDMLDTIKITVYYTGTVDGAPVNYTDSVEYSVAQYFFERLYKNGVIDATEGQDLARKNLYSAALSYGAAAQNLLTSDTELISNKIYVWGESNLNLPGLVDKGDYNLALGENLYKFTYYSLNGADGSDVASGTGYYGLDKSVKVTSTGTVVTGPEGSANFDTLTPSDTDLGPTANSKYTAVAGATEGASGLVSVGSWSQNFNWNTVTVAKEGSGNYLRHRVTQQDSSSSHTMEFIRDTSTEGDVLVLQMRLRISFSKGNSQNRFYTGRHTDGTGTSTGSGFLGSGAANNLETPSTGIDGSNWFTMRIVVTTDGTTATCKIYKAANAAALAGAEPVITKTVAKSSISSINNFAMMFNTTGLGYVDYDYVYFNTVANLDAVNALTETVYDPEVTRNPDYAYTLIGRDGYVTAGTVTTDSTTVQNIGVAPNDYSYVAVRTEDGETFLRAYKSNQDSNATQTNVHFGKASNEGSGNVVTFEARMRVTAPEGQTMSTSSDSGFQVRLWGSSAINKAYLNVSGGKIAINSTKSEVDVGEWFTLRITYTYNEAGASATVKIAIIDSDGGETPVNVTPLSVVTPDNIKGFRLTSGASVRIVVDVKDAGFSVSN